MKSLRLSTSLFISTIAVVVGIAIGLIYAWQINPVVWTNLGPQDLEVASRHQYIYTVANLYSHDLDQEQVLHSLEGWEDATDTICMLAAEEPDTVTQDRLLAIAMLTTADGVGCGDTPTPDIETSPVAVNTFPSPSNDNNSNNMIPPDSLLFVDVSDDAGITSTHQGKWDENLPIPYDNGYLAAGMAWSDFDNDGWVDLFVTGNLAPNVLYHNNQDGSFSISEYSDLLSLPDLPTGGAVWADYDNDGWRDLYVLNMGANRLFRNLNGNGFEDVTMEAGVGDNGKSTTAAWGDYNKDGHLDLYVTNWSCYPACETTDFSRSRDVLYHNNGDGTFTDVSGLLDYNKLLGAGFSVSFVDYDNDLDLDLYIVNDKVANPVGNVLWRNDGPGCQGWCWTDASAGSNTDSLVYGMALAVGDYDNDLDLDFYVPNMVSDMVLLENLGDGTFANMTQAAGVHYATEKSVGWGTAFLDFDNDGWLDLYLAATGLSPTYGFAGKLFDFPDMLYRNQHDGTFAAMDQVLFSSDAPLATMGLSTADFNNDGWVDYALTIWNEGHLLYQNTALYDGENNWLTLTLAGGNDLPQDPIGTRVIVTTTDGTVQIRELKSGSSIGAGNDLRLHFGLGTSTIEQIEVHWLNGEVNSYLNVDENQHCLITPDKIECSNSEQ